MLAWVDSSPCQWSWYPGWLESARVVFIQVIDDLVFAIGGFNGVTTIFNVECYDAGINEWYECTDMSLYRSALAACIMRELPNVRDYVRKDRDRKRSKHASGGAAVREPNNPAALHQG